MNDDPPLPDSRDAQERAAVAAILAELPPDHPARRAHDAGVDTIRLMHLVAERPDLVERLKIARLDAFGRTLGGGFRP